MSVWNRKRSKYTTNLTDAERLSRIRQSMSLLRTNVNKSLVHERDFDADGRLIDCHQADSFLRYIEDLLYLMLN